MVVIAITYRNYIPLLCTFFLILTATLYLFHVIIMFFIEFTTIIHTVGPRVAPPATREYQGVPGSPTYFGRSSRG